MSTTQTGFEPRGADTLPRPEQEQERQVGKALLAGAGLLALVVGVPWLLIAFVGNPLPTSMPDGSWLQADLTASTLIKVIAVLVWIVWAHFMICLLTELRAVRAGRMPGLVPLGGGTQVVARRLIAGVLLLAGTATLTGNAPTAGAPPETRVVSARALDAQELRGTPGQVQIRMDGQTAGPGADAAETLGGIAGQAAGRAGTSADAPALKFYEVKPPEGRNYDCLWDIAERTLGDPYRYKEIFELNRDRLQPDGRRLVDADLIHPGWQLVLPADARGADVEAMRVGLAPSVLQDRVVRGTDTVGEGLSGLRGSVSVSGQSATGQDTPADEDSPSAATDAGERSDDLGEALAGGGMVLAGVLLALSTRRGAFGTPDGDDEALRLAANPGRADLLDRALRVLSQGRRSQGLDLPDAVAVYVNDDKVIVHVAGTPETPPSPWQVADGGRSWTVLRSELEGLRPSAPAPWPALVCIAESHGFDLLVDLEYAPGLVSIGGNGEVSRDVALSMAVDLVTHPWSDAVEVTMVGFGDDLTQIAPSRIHHVDSLEEAIADAKRTAESARSLLRQLRVDGVLAGRSAGHTGPLRPRVLILSGPPTDAQAELLAQLTAEGRSVLTTVCVGNTLAARWRFVTDAGGSIDLGALGLSGIARRLSHEGIASIRTLLREASDEAGERAADAAVGSPAGVLSGLPESSRVGHLVAAPDAGARRRPRMPAGESLAQVLLLGPVEVQARGQLTASRLPLLTELVAMVALHPDGVHESVLRVGLWPRGVDDDVVDATLAAAQQWLGADEQGEPLLRPLPGARWQLGPAVHVDWAELVTHADVEDPHEVTSALAVGRGQAFSATPAGRYSWLAWHRAARDSRMLATAMARSASGRHHAAGDLGAAERTLRLGLTLVPTAQALWRDLVRLGDRGPGGAAAVVDQMREALGDQPWEPETTALVQHALPGDKAIS